MLSSTNSCPVEPAFAMLFMMRLLDKFYTGSFNGVAKVPEVFRFAAPLTSRFQPLKRIWIWKHRRALFEASLSSSPSLMYRGNLLYDPL